MVYNILFNANLNAIQKILMLIAFILSAMFAICLHELAHGFVAYKMGDPTAKNMGRLTINPMAHFEPIGLLMFLFVGIGWAKPVPINQYNFTHEKKGLFFTSIAGVVLNLILGVVAFGFLVLFGYIDGLNVIASQAVYYLVFFCFYFALYACLLNVALFAFNILPIYPLDGFRIVEILSRTENGYVRFMRRNGQYILIGIVLVGVIFDRLGFPQLDIFGEYLSLIQSWVIKLFEKIMESIL